MAKVTHTANVNTSPRWAADFLSPDKLIPGGARLHAADFSAGADGKKRLASGTFLGRTFAERTSGQGFGPYADGDDEQYIAAGDVVDIDDNPDVSLVGHNTKIYENRLPGWSGLVAGTQTAIRAAYQCIISGEETV